MKNTVSEFIGERLMNRFAHRARLQMAAALGVPGHVRASLRKRLQPSSGKRRLLPDARTRNGRGGVPACMLPRTAATGHGPLRAGSTRGTATERRPHLRDGCQGLARFGGKTGVVCGSSASRGAPVPSLPTIPSVPRVSLPPVSPPGSLCVPLPSRLLTTPPRDNHTCA